MPGVRSEVRKVCGNFQEISVGFDYVTLWPLVWIRKLSAKFPYTIRIYGDCLMAYESP